jgi:hypothetical protein
MFGAGQEEQLVQKVYKRIGGDVPEATCQEYVEG